MRKQRPEAKSPELYRWIVDGHNVIFSVEEWKTRQEDGRRREARELLEASFESFGRAIGRQVWVVFDGNSLWRNPDVVAGAFLRTVYSDPPEEADDRICLLAEQCLRHQEVPVVVSSDRRTLINRLPVDARSMSVDMFFELIHEPAMGQPEKWSADDLSDIEQHFLENSPFESDRRANDAEPDPTEPDEER